MFLIFLSNISRHNTHIILNYEYYKCQILEWIEVQLYFSIVYIILSTSLYTIIIYTSISCANIIKCKIQCKYLTSVIIKSTLCFLHNKCFYLFSKCWQIQFRLCSFEINAYLSKAFLFFKCLISLFKSTRPCCLHCLVYRQMSPLPKQLCSSIRNYWYTRWTQLLMQNTTKHLNFLRGELEIKVIRGVMFLSLTLSKINTNKHSYKICNASLILLRKH